MTTMKRWVVYHDGEEMERVSFVASMDSDEVRRSLIDHDGFPDNITVGEEED